MAILWTLIVLGALLQGMQCNADNSTTSAPNGTTQRISDAPTTDSTKTTTPSISLSSTEVTPYAALSTSASQSNKAVTTSVTLESTVPSFPTSTTDSNKPTAPTVQNEPTSSVTNASTVQNGAFTTQVTTNKPDTQNTGHSTQSSSTTDAASNLTQGTTTNLNTPATTTSTEAGTTQLLSTQTKPSPSNFAEHTTSPITEAPKESKSTAQNLGTTKAQTTASTIGQDITNSTPSSQTIFNKHIMSEVCKVLGQNMKGNCTARVTTDNRTLTVTVTINVDHDTSTEYYKPLETDRRDAKHGIEDKNMQTTPGTINGTEGENKGTIPDTLIAIMASCGALVLILCCFAAYCTYHRRSYRKNQQHLTEELQTVENGYHDNPTLEVMEVQPEMQEKKLTMNGEFNDSWIVPIDNLLKEDIPDEEDTHL